MKKKISIFIFLFIVFVTKARASENTFYLGEHVPNIYIYMNRVNKEVYRQFREIYTTDTNELVYCIQPGESLSGDIYADFTYYNPVFNLNLYQWDRITKLGYYGYLYKDHTDIKWYAITQYLIWKETMPSNWQLYFVDKNHNKIDDIFKEEINELLSLVNNHHEMMNFSSTYDFNLNDDMKIVDSYNILSNYRTSKGEIKGNVLDLNNSLDIGTNRIEISHINHVYPHYYFNSNGQNIFKRGDALGMSTTIFVNVHSGKLKITECDDKTFKDDVVGGIYEVLDQDDEVVDTIDCSLDKNCLSNNLPIGNLRIRVKKLNDTYEINKHIYDVTVTDNNVSDVRICSLKKDNSVLTKRVVLDEPIVEEEKIIKEEKTDFPINEEQIYDSNEVVIDIPKTYKSNNYYLLFLSLGVVSLGVIKYVKDHV